MANARLVFEDNTVANLTASRISDTAIRKLRLFNDQKYFSVNLQNPAINTYAVKNKPVNDQNTKLIFSREDRFVIHRQENIPKQNALYQELVSFISSIQSTRNTLVDASAGREAIKIALEIQKKINEEK